MATNMALEARQVLSGSGFEHMGSTLLLRSVGRTALDEHTRNASWYNDDAQFQQAVGEVIVAKSEVLQPATRCELMRELLSAEEQLEGAKALGRMVELKLSSDGDARRKAASLLRKLAR